MVMRESVCLRRAARNRAEEVQFGRFLANGKVTTEGVIEGWSEQTSAAARGRHVLAIQDTTELNFATTPERRRGLGEIGKGIGHGALLHAMLAVDAYDGTCLGLVAGQIWTRQGRVQVPHDRRRLTEKESGRWIATPQTAKLKLTDAASVTVVDDRESDIYAKWALLPGPGFHVITRIRHDRRLADGSKLYATGEGLSPTAATTLELPARPPQRPARTAHVTLRYGPVTLRRPRGALYRELPEQVSLNLIEVVEPDPPEQSEPIHWRLLTTHSVFDPLGAWQVVNWYKARWIIEQLFRVLKTQGLKLEDSQLTSADRLLKLIAIAAKAAAVTIQLLQARDGNGKQPAELAFQAPEIEALDALNSEVEGKTRLQKNPHPKHSLAWASWIIARLGGWDGYPSSKPPGPITFRLGLEYFHALVRGWTLRNVCMP